MKNFHSTLKIIDKAIFVFIFIFLTSLTNSVFVNQLGYYGALILLLIRFALTKENPFSKTGLEIPFLLYIGAEILSMIFTLDYPEAIHNFFKRILLIPTLYVIIAAVTSQKRAKSIYCVYLVFGLITCFIYLYNAYDYWIYDQFAVKGSGPSMFQYPITAGELISFLTLILFAFVINEKWNWKYSLLNMFGFAVAALALLSTYKRTGWIGTAAGIFIILILKKQWKLLSVGALTVVLLFIFEKSISNFYVYSVTENQIQNELIMETDGYPYHVYTENDAQIISDYSNGLLIVKDDKLIDKVEVPGAVIKFTKWKDNYYVANLTDSRFLLYEKHEQNHFISLSEFISPGYVNNFETFGGYLYVNDSDSGLTVFRDPLNLSNFRRFPSINNVKKFFIDSSKVYFLTGDDEIRIYSSKNMLPENEIINESISQNNTSVNFFDNLIFIANEKGLAAYSIDNDSLNIISKNRELKNIYLIEKYSDKYLLVSLGGRIYLTGQDSAQTLITQNYLDTGRLFTSLTVENNKIFAAEVKEGRLGSIFDPYKPSNFVRFALWRFGWELFKEYPVVGVGDIDLAFLYREYKRDYDKEIQGHLHNNYMHLLATLGIVGFAAAIFLLIKMFLLNLKIYSTLKNKPFVSSIALGSIGGYTSFLVAGLTEWNFADHEVITMVYFTLGLSFGLYRLVKHVEKN